MTTKQWPNPLTPAYIEGLIQKQPDNFYTRQGLIGKTLLKEKFVPFRTITGYYTFIRAPMAGIYAEEVSPEPFPGDLPAQQWTASLMHLAAKAIIDPQSVVDMVQIGEIAATSSANDKRVYRLVREEVDKRTVEIDQALERTIEYLIMSALQGSITWPPPGTTQQPQWGKVNKTWTIDGFDSNLQFTATNLATDLGDSKVGGVAWTDRDNSKPHWDMEAIDRYVSENYGFSTDNYTWICSRNVIRDFWLNANLKSDMGSMYPYAFMNVTKRGEWIQQNIGFSFRPYDARFTYTDLTKIGGSDYNQDTGVRYLPQGRMIGIPNGQVGYLATSDTIIQDGKVATGKYTGMKRDDEHPFHTRVWVGQVCWPIITMPHRIIIFDTHL